MEESNGINDSVLNLQTARHLAARAIMALRSGFCVQRLSLNKSDSLASGIVCDWKNERASYTDDVKLIRRGFAFVYIGTIIDQKTAEALSGTLQAELTAYMSSALEAREAAVEWQLVSSVNDTNPFAHVGYKLASRMIRSDGELIEQLAVELVERQALTQSELDAWYETHAQPLSLEELEQSVTF
jgi:hypothetical protein